MAHNIDTNRSTIQIADMICFNQQCINRRQQLFKYSTSRNQHNNHLLKKCYILHLHPLNHLELIQKQLLEQLKETFLEQNLKVISTLIYSFKTRISNLYTNISELIIQEWAEADQYLLNERMINQMKENSNVEGHIQWLNNLYFQNKQSLKKTIGKLMTPTIQKLKIWLNKFNIIIDQKIEEICKAVQKQYRSKSNSQFQSSEKNNLQNTIRKNSNLKIEQEEGDNREISNNSQVQNSSQIQQQQSLFNQKEKNESLKKCSKKLFQSYTKRKSITKNRRNKYGRFLKSTENQSTKKKFIKQDQPPKQITILPVMSNCPNEVIEVSEIPEFVLIQKYNQLVLKNTEDINKLLSLDKGYQIDKLVFFCTMSDDNFVKIINTFKPIKVIFNCSVRQSKNLFHQIRKEILSNLLCFEQHWDHNEYFKEIAQSKHFPKTSCNYKDHKKNHSITRFWTILTSLKNIWISNRYQLKKVKDDNLFLNIQSLRIQPCDCKICRTNTLLSCTLKYFKDITTLKTLIIKRCKFDALSRNYLQTFIKNNKKLECIFLENNTNISSEYLTFLNGSNLKKLAVINQINFTQEINCIPIFKMKSLQYLYINSITFSKDTLDTKIGYDLQKTCITNLKNLVFLDLYNLNSDPKFISYMHPQTYQKLTYLNLGYTQLNSQAIIPFLALFKSLQYLSLDGTTMNLTNFFKYKKYQQNLSKSLRYLSLRWFVGNKQQKKFKNSNYHPLTEQNFSSLISAFPNLQYLNISDSLEVISAQKIMSLQSLTDLCVDKRYTKKDFIQKMNEKQIKIYRWQLTVNVEQLLQ